MEGWRSETRAIINEIRQRHGFPEPTAQNRKQHGRDEEVDGFSQETNYQALLTPLGYFQLQHRQQLNKYQAELATEIKSLLPKKDSEAKKLKQKQAKFAIIQKVQNIGSYAGLKAILDDLRKKDGDPEGVLDGRCKRILNGLEVTTVHDGIQTVTLDLSAVDRSHSLGAPANEFFSINEQQTILQLRDQLQIEVNCFDHVFLDSINRMIGHAAKHGIQATVTEPTEEQLSERTKKCNKIRFLNELLVTNTNEGLHRLAQETVAQITDFPDALKGRHSRVLKVLTDVTTPRLYFNAAIIAEIAASITKLTEECTALGDPSTEAARTVLDAKNLQITLLRELQAVTSPEAHTAFVAKVNNEHKNALVSNSPLKRMLDKVAGHLEPKVEQRAAPHYYV
jgi:hypothetical protein